MAETIGKAARARHKRPRNRKLSPVAKAIATRAELNKEAWARRHPAAARAERALRKARAAMLERWNHKHEGTPETHEQHARRKEGALARLYASGAIDGHQLASAEEIALVHARIGADVAVRTASLETRVDRTRMGDGAFYERLGQVRREIAYGRWRAELVARKAPIAAVLDMIVADVGFTIAAARHRIGARRARRWLIDALTLWPEEIGAAAREVDREDLDRAHARIR